MNKGTDIPDMPEYAKEFFYQQLDQQDIHLTEHIETDFMGQRKLERYLVGPGLDPSVVIRVITHETIITHITIAWLEQPPKGENYKYLINKDIWSILLPYTQLEKKWFLYDMYIAAKNKYEGKPYFNPYKDRPDKFIPNSINVFMQILDAKTKNIFPTNMPIEKRLEALNELKNVLYKHIAPYRKK